MDKAAAAPTPRRGPIADAVVIAAVAVAAAAFYFAAAVPGGGDAFSRSPQGYYGLQTAGFRAGHLHMSVEPDPALLALKDPYDPAANAPWRIHDVTLYRGHYYLYFGAAPAVLWFWPCAALTGLYPGEPFSVALACTGAAWIGLGLLLAAKRRHHPDAPPAVLAAAALCLAFATPMTRLLQGPQVYQVPIAFAALLQAAMFAACFIALGPTRRPLAWLAAAGLMFGLLIGARPNQLPAFVAPAIAAVAIGMRRARGEDGSGADAKRGALATVLRRSAAGIAAAGAPAALCGAALLAYNAARFGSPGEFGMKYQLAGESLTTLPLLDLRALPGHAREYLFGPAIWRPWFPFLTAPLALPVGMLRYLPWAWLALAAPFVRRNAFAGAVLAAAAANLLLLSDFYLTTDRYPVDFSQAWLLAAGLGALALTAGGGSGGRQPAWRWRRAWVDLSLVLSAMTLAAAIAIFASRSPETPAAGAAARWANLPVYAWERARGDEFGAVRLSLEFPVGAAGRVEPLIGTGAGGNERDWIEIEYLSERSARVAFFHAGASCLQSRPFDVPPDRHITLVCRFGSLIPPYESPLFEGWPRERYEEERDDLTIEVDGTVVLRAAEQCYAAASGDPLIGRPAGADSAPGPVFSGRVLSVTRLPFTPRTTGANRMEAARPVELSLLFPSGRSAGADPLIATGEGTRSDLLYCVYSAGSRVRFALDHYGGGGPETEAVDIDPLRIHTLKVWMGSMAADGAAAGGGIGPGREARGGAPGARTGGLPGGDWRTRLVVVFDGRVLLNVIQPFYPGGPGSARFGTNPHHSSATGHRFTGVITGLRQPRFEELPAANALAAGYGPLDIALRLPQAMTGAADPIAVTGVTGAGDILYLRYVDKDHVVFGFDHWGVGGLTSRPVAVDYGKPHHLRATMASLLEPGSPGASEQRVRIEFDGATVLDGQSPCHPTAPADIHIGENPIGGSTCGDHFHGQILSVER